MLLWEEVCWSHVISLRCLPEDASSQDTSIKAFPALPRRQLSAEATSKKRCQLRETVGKQYHESLKNRTRPW